MITTIVEDKRNKNIKKIINISANSTHIGRLVFVDLSFESYLKMLTTTVLHIKIKILI